MAYDINKFHKLGALKEMGLRVAQELEKTNQKIEDIEIPEYSLVKQGTAESGYLSTYYLTKDGAQVGEKINIPKDFLVNSADILEVDTADQPYAGAQVGDLYIDFVINSKTADDTASHVYLPVNELVDAYTSGNGIDISASNVVSVKIDSANANGLEVGAAGLKLNAATASTPGAMSAADKTKLDGLNNYTHPSFTAHGSGLYKITVDENGHVTAAEAVTKGDITNLGIPGQDTTYSDVVAGGASGLMTGADKSKLDGIAEGATKVEASATAGKVKVNGADITVVDIAADEEVQEMLDEIFPAST